MKYILNIFVIAAVVYSNNNAMELDIVVKKNSQNAEKLLENNAAYLKKLIAVENGGCYSRDLYKAEKTLQNFNLFDIKPAQEVQKEYSQETIQLASLIAQRRSDRTQIYEIVFNKDRHHEMVNILRRNPYMINAYGRQGETLLHFCALHQKESLMINLLDLKANPNCKRLNDNRTPLHITSQYTIVQLLIAFGANVNMRDKWGKTPLFYHIFYLNNITLLFKHGALVNVQDMNGDSPLHEAVRRSCDVRFVQRYSAIIRLIERGANPDGPNDKGKTPINLACKPLVNDEVRKIFTEYCGYTFSK